MNDTINLNPPPLMFDILKETEALGFHLASEPQTGSFLRTLAASKPSGLFLELGTGTGVGTAWILQGMDPLSKLISIDNDPAATAIAQRYLGNDPRVTFYLTDGIRFLNSISSQRFDFIFADTWAGKYDQLDKALSLLNAGGLYIIDDMLPQPNWPEGHAEKVSGLISVLEERGDLVITKMGWSTGLIVATKKG